MNHSIDCEFCGVDLRFYSSRDDCCDAAKNKRKEEVEANLIKINEQKRILDLYGIYYWMDTDYKNLPMIKVSSDEVVKALKRIGGWEHRDET